MNTISKGTCAAAFITAFSLGAFAQPVQWRLEDGGNGHWYQVIAPTRETTLFFSSSNLDANLEMYYVQRGFLGTEPAYWQSDWDGLSPFSPNTHIVQIQSQSENQFVQNLLQNSGKHSAYLGLHQVRINETPPIESEPGGGWYWDSGDPLSYSNWAAGQPDNAPPGQHVAVMDVATGTWSDWGLETVGEPDAVVIEYVAPIGPSARFVSAYATNRNPCRLAPPFADPAGTCSAIGRTHIAVNPGDSVLLCALVGEYACPNNAADWMRGSQRIESSEWFKDGVSLGLGDTTPIFAGFDSCNIYYEGSLQCEGMAYTCNTADRTYSFVFRRQDVGQYDLLVSNIFGKSSVFSFFVDHACPADFNVDGGVDGDDIVAFFISWEGGDVSADVNLDGGIDGTDVSAFFNVWQAGAC